MGQEADTEFKFIIFASASLLNGFFRRTFFTAASISPGTSSIWERRDFISLFEL
jgi:hypothetical protein